MPYWSVSLPSLTCCRVPSTLACVCINRLQLEKRVGPSPVSTDNSLTWPGHSLRLACLHCHTGDNLGFLFLCFLHFFIWTFGLSASASLAIHSLHSSTTQDHSTIIGTRQVQLGSFLWNTGLLDFHWWKHAATELVQY